MRALLFIGRALLALGKVVFWPVGITLRAAAKGIRKVLRRAAPYAVGGGAAWLALVYQPDLFMAMLAVGLAIWGLWLIVTAPFRGRGK